jgi:hypothetical protein
MLRIICRLGKETAGAIGLAILARSEGQVKVVSSYPVYEHRADEPAPDWLTGLATAYSRMLAEDGQIIVFPDDPENKHGLFVPLVSYAGGSVALSACLAGGRPVRLQNVLDILQLVRASLFLAEKNTRLPQAEEGEGEGEGDDDVGRTLVSVVDILGEVQAGTRFAEVAEVLCSETAARLNCRRVALGEVKSRWVKVLALDQMESFATGTRPVRFMEEAMQEAVDQDRPIFYSTAEEEKESAFVTGRVINRAAKELARHSQIQSILTLPLRQAESVRFVLLLMLDGESLSSEQFDAFNLLARLATPRLTDLRSAEAFPLMKAWNWLLLRSADMFGPRRTVLKLIGFFVGLFLLASLLIRGEVIVSADLVIEGVHSYTHTAPMDSYLTAVEARPGDQIKKDNLLGRLDSTEIQMEINSLTAQLNIYTNQMLQFTQEGKDAEAEIARLEAEKVESNLAWAERRLEMTELRSSVDGFLVSEDMFPRLGQPVRRGQDLFEVTDTASLRVVVHVDESDISDINREMSKSLVKGIFTLTAYPSQHIDFEIERIHPYAEVAGESNGFKVRGRLVGPADKNTMLLRPGMEGRARIKAGRQPLLFVWTRKLVARIRLLYWRWLG